MEREEDRRAEHAPYGIYAKTTGEDATVPGVNVPYEEPVNPEVVVDSETMSVEECAKKVATFILRWYEEAV
jgi:adenylylsulfate kinase-like enzyme